VKSGERKPGFVLSVSHSVNAFQVYKSGLDQDFCAAKKLRSTENSWTVGGVRFVLFGTATVVTVVRNFVKASWT
jgi:hypothetical protein